MEDNTLEGQGQSNSVENECDYDEIDIISHPAEHEIAEIKRETSSDGHCNERQDYDWKSKHIGTSAASSKKTARFSDAIVDSGISEHREKLVKAEGEFSNNCLDKVQFTSIDEGIPDENDLYKRFYFESDHLALKDNAE